MAEPAAINRMAKAGRAHTSHDMTPTEHGAVVYSGPW